MTQRLQQALKLLQVPTLELQQLLKVEMNTNPLLEEIDDLTEEPEAETADGEAETGANLEKQEAEPEEPAGGDDEIDWAEILQDGSDSLTTRSEERQTDFVERVPVSKPTLDEHLEGQLRYLPLSEEERTIGDYIIGSIDDRGYLTMGVEEIAAELKATTEAVERVLAAVQSLEPPGVGARDLRECLLLQLKARGQEDGLAYKIVRDHFDDLVRRRLNDIARALRTTVEEVQEAIDMVGTLSPKPGNQVAGPDAATSTPTWWWTGWARTTSST